MTEERKRRIIEGAEQMVRKAHQHKTKPLCILGTINPDEMKEFRARFSELNDDFLEVPEKLVKAF